MQRVMRFAELLYARLILKNFHVAARMVKMIRIRTLYHKAILKFQEKADFCLYRTVPIL